jgi:HD superfamily phosphohydrolase YqeK
VLFSAANGAYYELDDICAAVWDEMRVPITVAEVCRRIAERYDVAPEICDADVAALLTDLARRGLVIAREEAGTV